MKKLVKLSMIALAASLVVGCATNGDIENLQGQIDGADAICRQVTGESLGVCGEHHRAAICTCVTPIACAGVNQTG